MIPHWLLFDDVEVVLIELVLMKIANELFRFCGHGNLFRRHFYGSNERNTFLNYNNALSETKMDSAKNFEALKAERDALEKALAVPGVDKDERLAIRKNIDSVDAKMTALAAWEPTMLSKRWWSGVAATTLAGMVTTGATYASARILNFPAMHAMYAGFGIFWIRVALGDHGWSRWPSGRWPKPPA